MMNRRTLLAGSAALTGSVTLNTDATAAITDARPPFDIMPDQGGWRVRSWVLSENAWRPRIARVVIVADELRIEGPMNPGDHEMICQYFKSQHRWQ